MIAFTTLDWHSAWSKIADLFYNEQGIETTSAENQLHGMHVKLDTVLYDKLADQDRIVSVVAMNYEMQKREVIGYTVAIIMPHPNYCDLLAGNIVMRFVRKPWRKQGIGRQLLRHCEAELINRNVAYVVLGERAHLQYSQLPNEWHEIEKVYIKWLS